MQASGKTKATFFALTLILAGFVVAFLDDWRASRQLAIARRALKARDADQALNAAREAARLAPNSGEVYFILARAFRRQGQLDSVRESLKRAASRGVTRDRIRREEWLAMAQAGQMQEARPHLSELLINPGDDGPEICEAFVNGFFLTYQLAEAFQILDVWEKDYPTDAQPHVFRAAFSSKTAAWAVTATHLRRALELEPHRNDIRLNLATTLLVTKETDEAAKLLEQARRAQPDNPEVIVAWAQILMDRGEMEEARSTLNRVIERTPKHVAAIRLLGEIASSAGRFQEAIQLLEEARAISRNDVKVRYALANALQRVGRDSDAQEHFEFVVRSNEANQRIEQLIAVVRVMNDDVGARFEIAELLRETGEPRDRLLWLQSVVGLDPNHKRAHAELAQCYAEFGNREQSRKHRVLAEAN